MCIRDRTGDLDASDMHELMFIYELKERLTVCLSVIAHLGARKETRWHSFAENLDLSLIHIYAKKGDLFTTGDRPYAEAKQDVIKGKGCLLYTSRCV